MSQRYAIGIDLGTTNCVLGYTPLDASTPDVQILPIPQLVAPGVVESLPTLPSFLYLSEDDGGTPYRVSLPNRPSCFAALGEIARRRSAESPESVVCSAKSWLCHPGVDRREAILPWGSDEDSIRISPVVASTLLLQHLVAVWNDHFPQDPFSQQQVVITVPASFDMAARELTREAAIAAGVPSDFILLEEPQAAVYSWIAKQGDSWRRMMKKGDRLLVCDVGGGTTDLTLIEVEDHQGEMGLKRLAVGNHLLVGGDNMDLTLAHFVSQKFASNNIKLNPWQSISLWHSCRNAKEVLLSDSSQASYTVSVLGRGTKLIGGTVSQEIHRNEAESVLLDGFFPHCQLTDGVQEQDAHGFLEMGLPYEQDTAITRHLAQFLVLNAFENQDPVPTRVLFNGGVFKSKAIRQRLTDCMATWGPSQQPPTTLGDGDDLDLAVATGAAHYAWTKEHGGLRIRSGTARSFYVGIESAGLAVPGMPRPLHALCVAPLGMEEGSQADVQGKEVGLVLGQRVRFRFFSSASRKQDQIGTLLRSWDEEQLIETSPLELTLEASETGEPRVPVKFHCKISELGILELWCYSTKDDRRWKLELNVREPELV